MRFKKIKKMMMMFGLEMLALNDEDIAINY